jgi:competence protein ComEC
MALPTLAILTLWFGAGALGAVGLVTAPAWACLGLLAGASALLLHSDARRRSLVGPGAAFAVVGFVLSSLAIGERRADCRAALVDGGPVTVQAILLEQPAGKSAPLRLQSLNGRACTREARVLLPRAGTHLHAGDLLSMRAVWQRDPPGNPLNPHAGVFLAREIQRTGESFWLPRMRGRIVERIRALFGAQAPLAEALLVAQMDGIDPRVKRDFAASGLAHVLAISGTHVALIAAIVVLLASLARLPAVLGNLSAAVAAVAYVLFLGAPYPAARAAIQIVLLLCSRLLQRPSHAFALLAAAALLIMLYDPLAVSDAGFQLSFAGLLGILLWRQPLIDRLPASIPLVLRDTIATSTAASLATTPIAAFHFGQVSTIAVFANLLAVPLVSLAVPAAACALLIDPIAHGAALFVADGARLLLMRLQHVAALAAAAPGGHFFITRDTLLSLLFGLALLWYAAPRLRQLRWPLRFAAQGGALGAVLVAAAAFTRQDARSIEIHAIDVGQGDAVAVRSPRGRWLLIDAGPRSDRYDAGASRVAPFLLRQGVHNIEVFVLTHPHLDHVGGAGAIARVFSPRLLLDPDSARSDTTLQRLSTQVQRWLRARPGTHVRFDQMSIEVLYPDLLALDGVTDPNDYSVVVRLGYGRFVALFTGDAPARVEDKLVQRYGARLDADLLKVGHHGSGTSTGSTWLNATTPEVAIISAGRGNKYGHPSPQVLERLRAAGVQIYRTDRDGTVSLRIFGDGRIEPMNTR